VVGVNIKWVKHRVQCTTSGSFYVVLPKEWVSRWINKSKEVVVLYNEDVAVVVPSFVPLDDIEAIKSALYAVERSIKDKEGGGQSGV